MRNDPVIENLLRDPEIRARISVLFTIAQLLAIFTLAIGLILFLIHVLLVM